MFGGDSKQTVSMSHMIPPMVSTTPPPLGDQHEEEEEEDFGDFAAADYSFQIEEEDPGNITITIKILNTVACLLEFDIFGMHTVAVNEFMP